MDFEYIPFYNIGRSFEKVWDKALELNDQYFDAKYSEAFCYEELGQYVKAYSIWNEIAETLDKEGLEYEAHHASDNAKRCIDREFIKYSV